MGRKRGGGPPRVVVVYAIFLKMAYKKEGKGGKGREG